MPGSISLGEEERAEQLEKGALKIPGKEQKREAGLPH
jgi:hypothetical protein